MRLPERKTIAKREVAQGLAHLNGVQGVVGSNPTFPT